MKKSDVFKMIFRTALSVLPGYIGQGAAAIESAVEHQQAPGEEKKAINVAKVTSSEAVAILNSLAKTDLASHPKFVEAVGKVNDAIVNAANVIAGLADATDGTTGDGVQP